MMHQCFRIKGWSQPMAVYEKKGGSVDSLKDPLKGNFCNGEEGSEDYFWWAQIRRRGGLSFRKL